MKRAGELQTHGWQAALLPAILATLMIAPAAAQTYSVLHNFTGTPDGALPMSGLAIDRSGNLYGTTYYGGAYKSGMVYRLAHKGSGWVMQPLYSFPSTSSGQDGAYPVAPVTIGPDGSVYGTTTVGAGNQGIVYKLTPPASACKSALCPWNETVLHRFSGGADGSMPTGWVTFDKAGNLYGTTHNGGTASCGVVYELSPSGPGWTGSVLYSFAGIPDGCHPYPGVTFDADGNMYGTTIYGGTTPTCDGPRCGTVFELMHSDTGWTESLLYSFQDQQDGGQPTAGVTFDASGNLYGASAEYTGTVFELTPLGSNWAFNFVYTFSYTHQDGWGVFDTPTLDAAGNILGTALQGDTGNCQNGCGNVFKLTYTGGGWSFSSLHDFLGPDGGHSYGSVLRDTAGNLYGTTSIGGTTNNGVVWEITP